MRSRPGCGGRSSSSTCQCRNRAPSGCTAPAAESKPEVPKPGEQTNNDRPHAPLVMQFTSAENYFPVFEGNTRDLQSLEARVVINITSFYTYMKTVRDLMRTAAALKPEPVTPKPKKLICCAPTGTMPCAT